MTSKIKLIYLLLIAASFIATTLACTNNCYTPRWNQNCPKDQVGQQSYTMHMSVHPHLDAYWIFNLDSYYDPQPQQGDVLSYFRSNRFHSVKQIFDTATRVLTQSKQYRQKHGKGSQKAHRSFMNSQMGFFKKWYFAQSPDVKQKVKSLLKTKYWEILGGAFVQHDQGCAYYDDIIENFQTGLSFLKEEFNYFPRAAISADSFGHSQTSLAILAHMGVEGYFVQRSDEHILLQNKTEFIWKAKSANGQYYGALPTHIRWAIHGFEDQFIGGGSGQNLCSTKQNYISNMRRQNQFMKRILHSPHIMRYFGHDFQQFDDYSYSVIEAIMEKFSSEKCNKVVAVYGNPTQYFMTLMGEVFGQKKKPIATRQQDIMPIWDYDSGLYWTGYYTTDPYHKKNYRDAGRFLYTIRKLLVPNYVSSTQPQKYKAEYETLEQLAQQVSYLQHHDGISGTSKYKVMDELQVQNQKLIQKVKQSTLKSLFLAEFDSVQGQVNQYCLFGTDCKITSDTYPEINLKIFNSAGYQRLNQPFIVQLPYDTYYVPNCPYEINCLCQQLPCQCNLYLYPQNYGTFVSIKLTKQEKHNEPNRLVQLAQKSDDQAYSFNETHFKIQLNGRKYSIGYKKVQAQATNRQYPHLSRYGDQYNRGFSIRSGKYALGNNPNKIFDLTSISKVMKLQSKRNTLILIRWNRQGMKTLISIDKSQKNQWKVQTHSAAQAYILEDLYLEIQTEIQNQKKFFTDSNGWLVMKRQLFHHEDYQAHFDPNKFDDIDGNSYPMTAFAYIQDANDKVSINTDRPQGAIAYRPGTLWVNFDRLSSDDGKWVYENTYRSDYQRFTHVITVQNKNNNQRKVQALYDMPVITQISYSQVSASEPTEDHTDLLKQWKQFSGLQNLKTTVKPINDTTVVVRVHNLNDKQVKQVRLFVGTVSPLLTAFYGNKATIAKVQERSLGNNMNYQEFLDKKWNWQNVVDLQSQNSIFNKEFGETITLRPLQIRTFLFYGLKFEEGCGHPSRLKINDKKMTFNINLDKAAPKRQNPLWQKDAVDYLLHQDHCNIKSPILIDKVYPQEVQQEQKSKQQGQNLQKDTDVDDFFTPRQEQTDKPSEEEPSHNVAQETSDEEVSSQKQSKQSNKDSQSQQQSQRLPDQLLMKKRIIEIRKKIQNLEPLKKEQKQIYFAMRLKELEEMLQKQSSNKP